MKSINRHFAFILTVLAFSTVNANANNHEAATIFDPMMPKDKFAREKALLKENLNLKAIAFNDDKPYCIINDELLSINDEIGNYKITKIATDEVILSNNEGKIKILTTK